MRRAFEMVMLAVIGWFIVMELVAVVFGCRVAIVPRDFDVDKAVVEWELHREGARP